MIQTHDVRRPFFIGTSHVIVADQWLIENFPEDRRKLKNFMQLRIDGHIWQAIRRLDGYGFIYRIRKDTK